MVEQSLKSRTLLQRRSSFSNMIQPALDGAAVIGIAWLLAFYFLGGLWSHYVVMLVVLLGIMAVIYDRFAIYRSNASYLDKALDLFKAWTLSFLVLLVLAFLTKQSAIYSRYLIGLLFIAGYLTQAVLHFMVRIIYKRVVRRTQNEKVIIIGHGSLQNYLQSRISANPWMSQEVVGTVRLPGEQVTTKSLSGQGKVLPPVLGDIEDLPRLIDEHDISTVYIVTPLESAKVLENMYMTLLDKHVSIHWIPDIFSLRLVNHSVREISGMPVITLSETPLIGLRLLLKAMEDKVLSAIILVLVSPVLLAVAIAVKLDSPGPVFFRQNRAGWNGKTFRIWKFRSMYVHQPEEGKIKQAEKNDSRITRVGAFIRKTSLDELPQIFNVLTGDMSLVGPRPHAIQHDMEYSQRIADYFARHNIKPGITGLAQVRGFRGETKDIDQMIQRIEADIEYINNWSVWLDVAILLRTTFAFTGKNAY